MHVFGSGFVQFRSKLPTVENLMPVEFVRSVEKLNHCFTERQVTEIHKCESSKDANGLIIKYLTANMVGVNDIVTFCTQMEKVSTSPNLGMLIKDLKRSCKFNLCCIFKYNHSQAP